MKISEKLELPCGAVVKNRFLKSAMTEGLASEMLMQIKVMLIYMISGLREVQEF